MVTMVTVWHLCFCKLLHMKVRDKDFMLMCHLPHSVYEFSVHDAYENDIAISVPT